jgi:hypothetical protein
MKKDEVMKPELDELGKSIARWTEHGDLETAVPGLLLYRRDEPTEPISALYEPSICVIAQGAKRVILGDDDSYVYDPRHYLISSVHLPTVVQVIDASEEKPCLGLKLSLDMREISQMMVDSNLPAPPVRQSSRGMATGEMTPPLLNALTRLVDLLTDEKAIPILAPTIQREISYRLLVGDQGARLRQIALTGSQSQQIARAIEWIKANFAQPFRVDDLSAKAGMSASTFHHHFRSMTALSPLQYWLSAWMRGQRRSKSVTKVPLNLVANTVACSGHLR